MDRKLILRIVFSAVIFLLSLALWYFFQGALVVWQSDGWQIKIIEALVSFVLLGATLGLFYLVEDDWRVLFGVLLFVLGTFFIFFPGFSYGRLLVVALAVIFFMRGVRQSYQEKSTRVKLVLASILLASLGPTGTGLAVLCAMGFASAPTVQSLNAMEFFIPSATLDVIFDKAESLSESLSMLPAGQKNTATKIAPSQKIIAQEQAAKEALYQQINQSLNALSNPYKKYLPMTLAIYFFFMVRFLSIILMRIAAMLAWALFGLLRVLKFIEIKTIDVKKEVIVV